MVCLHIKTYSNNKMKLKYLVFLETLKTFYFLNEKSVQNISVSNEKSVFL